MYTMTKEIIEALKVRTPFYDRYILAKNKKKEKNDCTIMRTYTNQVYHVFSLILRASTPRTLSKNLLNPDKWIDPTRQAIKDRKKANKKNDIQQMNIKNHCTESALSGTNEQTIRKALKEAHEILFETEFDELPLVSHIQGWQFLITLSYEAYRAEQLNTTLCAPTKTLIEDPTTIVAIKPKKK